MNNLDNNKTKKSTKKAKSAKAFEIYPDIVSNLKKGSKLSTEDMERLEKIFGERVKKALNLIGENRVKKYLFTPSGVIRWVVTGYEKDYLVIEQSFCSCKDFLYTALFKREVPSCYHLLAREIAERIEKYDEITIEDNLYATYMDEWLE
ncbi:MAG: hypothetical protein ACTSXA_03645 [Candidatus Heimdallarchaeota archaeon]